MIGVANKRRRRRHPQERDRVPIFSSLGRARSAARARTKGTPGKTKQKTKPSPPHQVGSSEGATVFSGLVKILSGTVTLTGREIDLFDCGDDYDNDSDNEINRRESLSCPG